MRIIITLENLYQNQPLYIPINYNKIITGLVYSHLKDKQYAEQLHNNTGFKYFTISRIYMYKYKYNKEREEFRVTSGKISFQVSSPDNTFINNLIRGISTDTIIQLGRNYVKCKEISIDPEPQLTYQQEYETLSPLLIRTQKQEGTRKRTIDLNPSQPQFYQQMKENTVKKYNQYYQKERYIPEDIQIHSSMKKVKGIRTAIKSRKGDIIYNRAYMMNITVEAPLPLQEFVYDVGLGEKTAMGFGCLKIV